MIDSKIIKNIKKKKKRNVTYTKKQRVKLEHYNLSITSAELLLNWYNQEKFQPQLLFLH